MTVAKRVLAVGMLAASAGAGAGALDECMAKGDHAAVSRCLVEADRAAQADLARAEAAAAKAARELDAVTGRPGAAAALAKSNRAFAGYRAAQCGYVRAMWASGSGADQAALACSVDATRERIRDLQP